MGDPTAAINENPAPLGEYDQFDRAAIDENRFTLQSVPKKFRDLLTDCSPIKNTHRHYWWRAQAATYFLRWNARTRKAMDQFRYRTLNNPGPDGHLAPYSVAIFVPRGTEKKYVRPGTLFDKSGGSLYGGGSRQTGFEPYIAGAKQLSKGMQDIQILRYGLAEANNMTFQYPRQEFNTRSLFVNPESDKGLEELVDATMGPFRTWQVSYTEHDRASPEEDTLEVALG